MTDMDTGRSLNLPPPAITRHCGQLWPEATLRDVVPLPEAAVPCPAQASDLRQVA